MLYKLFIKQLFIGKLLLIYITYYIYIYILINTDWFIYKLYLDELQLMFFILTITQ